MKARTVAIACVVVGALIVLGDISNLFMPQRGATAVAGAVMIAGGVIAYAIADSTSRLDRQQEDREGR
ncbi:MAG: hypothetical protein HN742_19120 [Lentisphaerae bacterium]|jgi:hypothetical protein|nr:hypothetical protein [Lentisphaerota bacterium]MBT4817263.1 hypothetical protein [Lentisphaerota bacterium]MBT5607803.1 hypothetical protein [Lentisphaerota bacterium]MBT7061475.1 hypothetical protein [Lentisphaerota bacterium]MBT7843999.1 hypothetical protein [Lentisphaerota bacterium]